MKPLSRLSSLLLPVLLSASPALATEGTEAPTVNLNVLGTRSIVACEGASRTCGIAVVSFPPTSATVPYGRPGLALASQMFPSADMARDVIALTDTGLTAQEALDTVLESKNEADRALRQLGLVRLMPDGSVQVGQFTGASSWTERCAVAGATYAVQAAGQTTPAVCQAMARGFEQATGSLALRLMEALKAGARVGQDSRGERSGTLRVWSSTSALGDFSHLVADATVNGRRDALAGLEQELYRYLGQVAPAEEANRVELDASTARQLKQALRELRYYRGPMHGRWTREAEDALQAFQARNVVLPRQTVLLGGKRYIDGPLVHLLLDSEDGSLVPAPR